MNRMFLMLASTWDESDLIGQWWMSEKFDGIRAYWDGGVTRGEVVGRGLASWANTTRDGREHRCTGLWSRYGKVIHAPSWWLDKLPSVPLDGELWVGRGGFQTVSSICRSGLGVSQWGDVRYKVFDSPSYDAVFADGELREVHYRTSFKNVAMKHIANVGGARHYAAVVERLSGLGNEVVKPVEQWAVPGMKRGAVEEELATVLAAGGEGLMFRRGFWWPVRSRDLVKVKGWQYGTGEVVGVEAGKGRLLGMMGSVLVSWQGREFSLSGFTDAERYLDWTGRTVKFKYRELTDGGVPKEARFVR